MAEWSHHGELKDHLNSIHPLIYPLLLWLVRSNRSYLRLLDPVEVPGVLAKLCILSQWVGTVRKTCACPHMRPNGKGDIVSDGFYLSNLTWSTVSSEDRHDQKIIQVYRSNYVTHLPVPVSPNSSFFMYHGSSFDNWHSILRIGLRNLSHTRYMTNGAAYGSGVYFSPKLSTASRYAGVAPKIWGSSEVVKDSRDSCIAICEIINGSCHLAFSRLSYS